MKKSRILGISSLIIALFLLVTSKINILGAVIGSNEKGAVINIVLILAFLLIGAGLFVISRDDPNRLESTLETQGKKVFGVFEMPKYIAYMNKEVEVDKL